MLVKEAAREKYEGTPDNELNAFIRSWRYRTDNMSDEELKVILDEDDDSEDETSASMSNLDMINYLYAMIEMNRREGI